MENYAIFYHTCDKYSDLWVPFCDFFKKYWPDYTGKIYINSEEKDFSYDGLNIINLKVGTHDFSKREILGLNKVEEDNILLMMDDLFLMGKVDTNALAEYFDFFKKSDLDSLVFRVFPSYEVTVPLNFRQASIVIPPSIDMCSSQLAFWKKESFLQLLHPADGPWEMEWFGSMRANLNHIKLACTPENVIPSLPEGGLHVGKWVSEMVDFLEKENYYIEIEKRGVYSDVKTSLKKRIKFQQRNWFSRSRIDLIKLLIKKRTYFWNR